MAATEGAQWDVQVLSKAVRESFPAMDFGELVKLFDSPNIEVVSPQCLTTLVPLFLRLLKQGFPSDWLYALWNNKSAGGGRG